MKEWDKEKQRRKGETILYLLEFLKKDISYSVVPPTARHKNLPSASCRVPSTLCLSLCHPHHAVLSILYFLSIPLGHELLDGRDFLPFMFIFTISNKIPRPKLVANK